MSDFQTNPEVPFLERFGPRSVLDAGCGTGRLAIELAGRGIDIVGVDIADEKIEEARRSAPGLDWRVADLSRVDLGRTFDAIVMAGNVVAFLAPGTEPAVLKNMARHLAPDGVLVADFPLAVGNLSFEEYDALAEEAGLALWARYADWRGNPWDRSSHYAVSVHRRRMR